jgi:uncharacterized protein (TIGR02722 family)
MNNNKRVIVAVALCIALLGCASAPVTSGDFDAVDVETVTSRLTNDCLTSAAVSRAITGYRNAHDGQLPVVIVGPFANETNQYLDTDIIAQGMETALINDGRFTFVAGGDFRKALRNERDDQQLNASADTAAEIANETGATYMMAGQLSNIVTPRGDATEFTYYVTVSLASLETNVKVWQNRVRVQAVARRSSVRF